MQEDSLSCRVRDRASSCHTLSLHTQFRPLNPNAKSHFPKAGLRSKLTFLTIHILPFTGPCFISGTVSPQGTSYLPYPRLPHWQWIPVHNGPKEPCIFSTPSSFLQPVLDFGSQRAMGKATKPSTHWWLGGQDWAGANLQSYPGPHTAQPQPL